MSKYNFEEQAELLQIAIQILEDYKIDEWSFGGGTALSTVYYNHRMSYDIDIFMEDFGSINTIKENYKEIATNLGISFDDVLISPSAVTFLLSSESHKLKIDFLYCKSLTPNPYIIKDILGQVNIRIQTIQEIISRKLRYRENITIRDFVDFAYVEKEDMILSELKKIEIINIDRFLDIIKQFKEFNEEDFNQELIFLNASFIDSKSCISELLASYFTPDKIIRIATNDNNEVLAFDEWVDFYKDEYKSIGEYNIYNISSNNLSYIDIYEMDKDSIYLSK